MAASSQRSENLVERACLTRRSAMKCRDDSYGTFPSGSGINSRESSFASSSRFTLEDAQDEGTALLGDVGAKTQDPPSIVPGRSPCLRLENSGSVARDHLASERTFLSYVRTSLSISMAGVVFGQIFLLSAKLTYKDPSPSGDTKHQELVRSVSVITILLGIVVVLIGAIRYFLTQSNLVKGGFSPARPSVALISILLFVVTTFVLFVIIVDAFRSD